MNHFVRGLLEINKKKCGKKLSENKIKFDKYENMTFLYCILIFFYELILTSFTDMFSFLYKNILNHMNFRQTSRRNSNFKN